ncbi:hypothetical protein LTR16_004086, partial [Cryomyces antarcticus]
MRSTLFCAATAFLSLSHSTQARVTNPLREREPAAVDSRQSGLLGHLKHLFQRHPAVLEERQQCIYDDTYNVLYNLNETGTSFCSQYISVPPYTMTVDYTPIVTSVTILETRTSTATNLVRYTPLATVTATSTTYLAKAKRAPLPTAKAVYKRDSHAAKVQMFVRQAMATNSTAIADPAFSSSLSSACSCLDIPQTTVTATYTNEPQVKVESGRIDTVATVNVTATAAAVTTTVTVVKAF